MSQDEEAAEAWLDHQEAAGAPERTERWSDWSAERDAMERLVDAVNVLIAVTVNAHGGKASRVRPGPRPATAAERVRERRRLAADRALKRRLGFAPPP